MRGGAIRAALAVFDDAALEALTNKGVVRRAAKDIEAGKVAITAKTDAAITVVADSETVQLDAQGPRSAKCTCPAPGICRHKVAAVMIARGGAGVVAETMKTEGTPVVAPADPLAEILALPSEGIAKWAGKPSLRAAFELLAESAVPEIRQEGAALVIRITPDEPEVRYLAGQNLDGMASKATAARLKSLHAAAVLAVRRIHGVTEAATIVSTEVKPSGPEAPDPEFLAQVSRTLEAAVFAALNQAPQVLEEQIFTLSISSRADALPRLSRQLRAIASAFRQKRARNYAFSPAAALSLIASTYALVQALLQPHEPEALAVLKGVVRQDYSEAGNLTLYGLGGNLWNAVSGAHGVTGYFYAAEIGRIVTASLARSVARDPSFDPATAYDNEALWQGGTLKRLIRSKFQLESASLSPDDRLSSTGNASAIEPWQATRQDCADWPSLHADWSALESSLQRQFHERLAESRRAAVPLLLAPAAHTRIVFDAHAQKHSWALADENGRWLTLTFRHSPRADKAAARLHLAVVQLVLAETRASDTRFEITPVSVVACIAGQRENTLINFELPPHEKKPAQPQTDDGKWFSYLASKPEGALPVAASSGGCAINATVQHCGEAADALLALAELGMGHRSPETARGLTALAERAEVSGLTLIADALRVVAACSEPGTFAAAFLRAVHVVERVRAQLRTVQ